MPAHTEKQSKIRVFISSVQGKLRVTTSDA
jgi:hypothetical protein